MRRHLALLLVLLVLAGAGAAAVWSVRPPAPRGMGADAAEFSAGRAAADVRRIAAEPHPTGSAAATRVRDYLADRLRSLGLGVDTGTSVAARPHRDGTYVVGTVANVHAVLPGRDPTGRVLLVAHYDSVPTGPGAADNASNVAAVLELVRALRTGGTRRNDVEVLFTDGEEAGLLGARAYAAQLSAADRERTAVINLEARGTSGSVIMFQTVGGSGRLAGALAASGAASTSISDDVYRLLPNYTDLTEFGDAGFAGLNFAYVAGSAHYHTAHDDLNHLDLASVQQMGDVVLPAVRHLAAADLTRELSRTGDDTYFTVLGMLVHYPRGAALPLALLAAAAVAALLWWSRTAGVRPARVGLVAAAFPLPLLGAVLIGAGVWWLLSLVRPEYRLFMAGDPYRPSWYVAGQVCLAAVALLLWHRWMRRRAVADEVGLAVLGWLAALGLLTAWLLPGGSYLFSWPALFGCAGTAAALRWCDRDSPWRSLAGAGTAAFAAVLLLLPVAVLLFPSLGLAASAAPLLFLTVAGAAGLGLVDLVRPRLLSAGTVALALVVPLLLAGGLSADRHDRLHPRPDSLGYAVDADTGDALWIGRDGETDQAVNRLLAGGPAPLGERFPNLARPGWRTGDAGTAAGVAAPRLERLGEQRRGGVRTVRVRIRGGAGTYRIGVYADTSRHRIAGGTVAGLALTGGVRREARDGYGKGARWGWGAEYVGPLSDGVVVELGIDGDGPLPLRVVAMSVGLPPEAGAPGRRGSPIGYPGAAGQVSVSRGFTV